MVHKVNNGPIRLTRANGGRVVAANRSTSNKAVVVQASSGLVSKECAGGFVKGISRLDQVALLLGQGVEDLVQW